MGDIADWMIEQGFIAWLDESDAELEDPDAAGFPHTDHICRYCGVGMLHWMDTGEGWRLVDDDGRLHTCPEYFNRKRKRPSTP